MKRSIVGLLTIGSVVSLSVYVINRSKPSGVDSLNPHGSEQTSGEVVRAAQNFFLSDSNTQSGISFTIHAIYEDSGHAITSWPQLVRTDYYPFVEPLATTCHGGRIKLQASRAGSSKPFVQLSIKLDLANANTWHNYYKVFPEVDKEDIQDFDVKPERITHRVMRAYLEGASSRSKHIGEVREFLVGRTQSALSEAREFGRCLDSECPLGNLTPKPMHICPIAGDFPKNQDELQAYLKWLRDTEGVSKLTDGWEHVLEFSLKSGKLIGRSRGSDGLLRTADDIVMQSP